MKKLLMGNEAAAYGALAAGVSFAAGYPGTPSTEAMETLAQVVRAENLPIHCEWSVNEKAAMETAGAASIAGLRSFVTMKQMGLDVAADPIMCLAYLGVKGGMVVYVADDPGPISSQTEQDTRTFARFAKLPVFDPSTPEELYAMVQSAYDLSERHGTPVILRPTTRICHASAVIDVPGAFAPRNTAHFEKDPKWVIFPRLSRENHRKIEARNPVIGEEFSASPYNAIATAGPSGLTVSAWAFGASPYDALSAAPTSLGIAAGGVSYAYVHDILSDLGADAPLLKVGTPHPFPESLAAAFLRGKSRVLVCEELDPVIERELTYVCGKYHIPCEICGKLTGHMPTAGENSYDDLLPAVRGFLAEPGAETTHPGTPAPAPASTTSAPAPQAPAQATSAPAPGASAPAPAAPAPAPRAPSLCKGCPHRLSFSIVTEAVGGRDAIYCGDIGCYTLGFAPPFHATDTCLCMGAGITMAQGFAHAQPDTLCVAFVGDSTFFASGMTGVANAVYSQADILVCVLDNSVTAMTGGQPHPGIGRDILGRSAPRLDIGAILAAMGAKVWKCDPKDKKSSLEATRAAIGEKGVRAVIYESPCITLLRK
jgi:indolepyruvate ferredoxin oxidoreductase alpha subunit